MSGPFGFSDAAKRISDAVNQAIVDGHRGRWMAFALEDGSSSGDTYDTRSDVVRYHGNAYRKHCYLQIPWDQLTPRAAEVYLHIHRQLTANGQHPADEEMPETQWMLDNRREAYPRHDARRQLVDLREEIERRGASERRTAGGLILP
jgi:hypothetical protein